MIRALNLIPRNRIIFLDIETVPQVKEPTGDVLSAWDYKVRNNPEKEDWLKNAALSSAFGKIACISVGVFTSYGLKIRSFFGEEKELLQNLFTFLDDFKDIFIGGHYIKSFDIPYIYQRAIVNRITPQRYFDTGGYKPWELNWMLDLQELWGSRESLGAIAVALGIPSPKLNMDGSEVAEVYFSGNLDAIVKYCEGDVEATALIFARLMGEEPELSPEEQKIADKIRRARK